ncbi:AP-4 complex subunit mu-like [Apium graveolens]|uniref:AP-4 complex subunit mu-like n=1 Tax=Apium graveolens TaxID=4045 RepID=UPI003D796584
MGELHLDIYVECIRREYRAEVILKIRAEFASSINANTIAVQMPLPAYTSRVSFELEPRAVGQTTDFKESNKRLEWNLKKVSNCGH